MAIASSQRAATIADEPFISLRFWYHQRWILEDLERASGRQDGVIEIGEASVISLESRLLEWAVSGTPMKEWSG